MAHKNEHTQTLSKIAEFRSLSYEEIRKRVLEKSGKELSSETVARRINTVRIEMRQLRHDTALTPNQYLTPFTI